MNSLDTHGRVIYLPEKVEQSSKIHRLTFIFPYFYLTIPVIMGMIISLAGYDIHIKKTLFESSGMSNDTSKFVWDMMNSCVPLGGFIGTFLIAFVSSRGNEKVIVLIIQFVGLVGSVLYFGAYFGSSKVCFTISRFMHGFFSGGAMSFGIITMFNLIPRDRHGVASTLIQPLINLGILLSGVFSLDVITKEKWIITIIPMAVVQVILTVIVAILPESPISIFRRTNDVEITSQALRRIRCSDWDIYGEVEQIRQDISNDTHKSSVTLLEFLKVKDLRFPLFITILLMVFQQFSGINIVIMQATELLSVFNFKSVDVATVVMLAVGFVAASISAIIVPRVGTKLYTVLGYVIMSIAFIVGYVSEIHKFAKVGLGAISVVLIGFNMGPGSLPWIIFRVTFELKYQQPAQGILTSFSWVANLLVVSSFSSIARAANVSPLLLFGILCFIFAVTLLLFMRETRNRSYSQIIQDYQKSLWRIRSSSSQD